MRFPISDSEDVKQLQEVLVKLAFPIAVDGIFGPETRNAVETFQITHTDDAGHPLVVDGVVGPLTWAALLAQTSQLPVNTTTPGVSAGFDTAFYPGDAPMQAWKASSPYSFVGYYLAAPAHPNASWMGKRQRLSTMGWEMVVIYVGRQAQGPGSQTPPDAAGGHAHGKDALAKVESEKFPAGTIVYLDVEPMDHIPDAMIDYVNAWLSEFQGSAYLTGIYCHKKNAAEIRAKTAGSASNIAFWVSGSGANFSPGVTSPVDSGIAFAAMWQGSFNQQKTFGGFAINIDENVGFSSTATVAAAAGHV